MDKKSCPYCNENISIITDQKQNENLILMAGVLGLLIWLIPIIAYIFDIFGLIYSIKQMKIKKSKKINIAICLFSISLLLALLNSIYSILKGSV